MHARKTFECTICEPHEDWKYNYVEVERPAFPTYSALQEHIRIDHPPTCELCGLKCTSNAALKSHVEVKHASASIDERKKFTCPESGCGAGFTKKGNLKVHSQSAHGSKRYVCGEVDLTSLNHVECWDGSFACGMALTTKANLQEHIRTIHLGLPHKGKSKAEKKEKKIRKTKASAVARITGANEEVDDAAPIPCAITGCNDRFTTEYDHEIHLQACHGLADIEIQDVLVGDEQDKTVFARPGFQGSTAFATHEDLDAEMAFNHQSGNRPNTDLGENPFEAGASNGGDFWLGGARNETVDSADEWLRDELEMHQLIDETHDLKDMGKVSGQGEMDVDIDPTLQ